jgi:pimeloyl-ACP methyl ester carboxylesterase
MGAGIALRYAIDHPEAVRGLILCSFPPRGDRSAASWALRFADAIEARGLEEAGGEFVWGGDRFDNDAARFIRQGFLEHHPHAIVAILRRVIATHPSVAELGDALRLLAMPTLIVVGARDKQSLGPCRELASAIPGAKLFEIPDAGHVVNLDKPKVFNEILGNYLREFDA